MKLSQCGNGLLIFSLTFIFGVFLTFETAQFQRNEATQSKFQLESIQRFEPEPTPLTELTLLEEKINKVLSKKCEATFDGFDDGLSLYEIQTFREFDVLDFRIRFIKTKEPKLIQMIVRSEAELRIVKEKIKEFEKDVSEGKINRGIYNRNLIYLENCIQK